MNKLSEMSVTLLNCSLDDSILFYVVNFIERKFNKKEKDSFVKLSDEIFFDSEQFKPKHDYVLLLEEERKNFERLILLDIAEINDIVVHENLNIKRFNRNQSELKTAYDCMLERIKKVELTDSSYSFICEFLNNLDLYKRHDCKDEVKSNITSYEYIIRELNESFERMKHYEFTINFKLKEIEERCSEMNRELGEILKTLSR